MKVELNRNNIGQPVLDIIVEKTDNKWETSEFYRFIEKAKKHGTCLSFVNEPSKGDLTRVSLNKYE